MGCKMAGRRPRFHQTACKSLKSVYHDPKRLQQLIADGIVKSANTLEELAENEFAAGKN